ncbi:hypothetical protein HMPREF2692_01310 [Corynebacterium sp. HMSC036D03]|uniref:hypothetical protein n=1 Tax=Corynebacterium sp. HMSC036D03 TaxID=1715171 RepID=UPI0008A904DF|nr:hypothetical protein [Corynebacterium sp. HMSC036D03]OHO71181.1 hypothetical protein HMPREF2692_01310 [Corynebacterium sp. HMSC036D03]
MVRVTLAKGCRLPGHPVRPAGFTMDVTDEVFAEFEPRGFFVGETVDEPTPAPAAETVDDESVDDEPAEDVKRPAKTAPVDTWRKYAESLGVVVKGLSKQEIIAATQ